MKYKNDAEEYYFVYILDYFSKEIELSKSEDYLLNINFINMLHFYILVVN